MGWTELVPLSTLLYKYPLNSDLGLGVTFINDDWTSQCQPTVSADLSYSNKYQQIINYQFV
jgi:hypothetical protein